MQSELTLFETTLFALAVSVTLGAMLALSFWVLKWVLKRMDQDGKLQTIKPTTNNKSMKTTEIVGRVLVFSLLYFHEVVTTTIAHFFSKVLLKANLLLHRVRLN